MDGRLSLRTWNSRTLRRLRFRLRTWRVSVLGGTLITSITLLLMCGRVEVQEIYSENMQESRKPFRKGIDNRSDVIV